MPDGAGSSGVLSPGRRRVLAFGPDPPTTTDGQDSGSPVERPGFRACGFLASPLDRIQQHQAEQHRVEEKGSQKDPASRNIGQGP